MIELFGSGPIEQLKKQLQATEFIGYTQEETSEAKVVGIIADGQLCDRYVAERSTEERSAEGKSRSRITVVLDRTPFYGEMGGQVGDHGWLYQTDGEGSLTFTVQDTQVDGGLTLHVGVPTVGELRVGMTVTAKVDSIRRQAIRRAHTATHLLHAALRTVLGEHAQQQGSRVDEDELRFDFPHPKAVSREELATIEERVNGAILSAQPVNSQVMPIQDARQTGAMMLFGEKYPDEVRVVSVEADPVLADMVERLKGSEVWTGSVPAWSEPIASRELCGGTHLTNTGHIGSFRITSEESIASGTRRITAITGFKAWRYSYTVDEMVSQMAMSLRTSKSEVASRVESMGKEIRQLKKQAAAAPKEGVSVEALLATSVMLGEARVVVAEVPTSDPGVMRSAIDQIRKKCDAENRNSAIFLAGKSDDGKVSLIAGLSRVLVEKKLSASDWLKAVAPIVKGGGGGRPDMAQAGGKDATKLAEAIDVAKRYIEEKLG